MEPKATCVLGGSKVRNLEKVSHSYIDFYLFIYFFRFLPCYKIQKKKNLKTCITHCNTLTPIK